jgi:hypothetical protein
MDNNVYHLGPVVLYLDKNPSGLTAASWDGLGRKLVRDRAAEHDVPRRDRLSDELRGLERRISHDLSAETHTQRRRASTSGCVRSSTCMPTLASVPRQTQVVGGR